MDAAPAADFPVTRCATCQKDVLCWFDLDEDGEGGETIRCVDCSTAAVLGDVRWVDLQGLEEIGYGLRRPRRRLWPPGLRSRPLRPRRVIG